MEEPKILRESMGAQVLNLKTVNLLTKNTSLIIIHQNIRLLEILIQVMKMISMMMRKMKTSKSLMKIQMSQKKNRRTPSQR